LQSWLWASRQGAMGTAGGLGGKDSADVPLAQFQTPPCDDAFALLEYLNLH